MDKKTVAKGAAAALVLKKLLRGAFALASVAAVLKVLRGQRSTGRT